MKKFLLFLLLLIIYLFISHYFQFYIPCPIKTITGLYCPGCGITRMFYSLLTLNIYSAFRHNPLVFISLPIGIYLYIDYLIKKDKSLFQKIPNKFWYIIIVVFIVYGIMRNLPIFSFLAPTAI